MAGELERFASACGAGATVGGALGAAAGSIIPAAGTLAGGAIGGALACLGAGAVAAWSGQPVPLAPVGGGTTAQVPVVASGVQMKAPSGPAYAGESAAFSEAGGGFGGPPTAPAGTSSLPLLVAAALALAVVLFTVSRRR